MTKPWWNRLPSRLLEEEQALSSLKDGEVPVVRSHRWIREPDGEPRVRVQLALGSRTIELEVRFPAHYPEGCPSVRPIPYASISSHQFGGTGVLCLELGPDNWHPRYTAADMVRSAWRLILQEVISTIEPIEIPSRHDADLAEKVRQSDGVLLVSQEFEKRVLLTEENTEFQFVWPLRNLVRVFPVAFPKGAELTDVAPTLSRETRMTGLFVRLAEGTPREAPKDPQGFCDFVMTFGAAALADETPPLLLLRWPDGSIRGFVRLGKKIIDLVNMPMDPASAPRVPPALLQALSAIKVGIVGLGSLGGKIAVSLGRSGVRRFVFVDGDVLARPNLCRHVAGHTDIGAMKVNAVAECVRDVSAAEPEITRYPVNLVSTTNPDLHARVLEDLGSADILIDAAANPDVFGLVAMIASDKKKPLVWGEVFGGGIGGFVASAHPEHGPCPRCVRAGFLATANAWPPAPAKHSGLPYADGDEAPLIATDADVTFIAAALTNRVFEMLKPDECPPAVVVLGIRRGWLFDRPFQTEPVRVRSDDWSCPRCWRTASEPDAEIAARAEALFSLDHDADYPPIP